MNLSEAREILEESQLRFSWQIPPGGSPKIEVEGQEILFQDDTAFMKYRTHDNCPECGSPTNWRTEAEEIDREFFEDWVSEMEEQVI